MQKPSLKQRIKESFSKLKPKKKADKPLKKAPENKTKENKEGAKKRFKLPKINLSFRKKKPEPELPTVNKALPKTLKIVDKYSLYEPFAQVFIVQEPKTGEYKYVLDELQLDTFERGIYNHVLEILLAEIESPKEEIDDP